MTAEPGAGAGAAGVPDAAPGNWIDRYAPPALRPYARLARWDRPVGWWLLLLPCWLSAALAADAIGRSVPNLWHMALFLVGAIAMRGAGCTLNDIVDRNLDAQVARTRSRPIPAGQVTVPQALAFLAAQALVGLAVLIQFNGFTIALALASLVPVAVYPFLKRITDWPQIGLGIAFSWGALLGWSAATGSLAWPPVLLFLGCVAWTIGYDTIYALQDRDDDAIAGIRSTARLFGRNVVRAVAAFYLVAMLCFAAALLTAGGLGAAAWAGLAVSAEVLAWQVRRLRPDDPANALRLFRANRWFGLVFLAGILLDAILTAA